jgi:hypothetical protein
MLLSYHHVCSSAVSDVRDKLGVQQRVLFTIISCYERNYSNYHKYKQQREEKFDEVCAIIRIICSRLQLNVTKYTFLAAWSWDFSNEDKLKVLAKTSSYSTSPDIIFTSAFSFWYDFIYYSSFLSSIFITTFYRLLNIDFCRILPVNPTNLLFSAS